MRAIDLHAHLTPQCFQREVLAGKTWHGMTSAEGELFNPMNAWTPEQRLADMNPWGLIFRSSPPTSLSTNTIKISLPPRPLLEPATTKSIR